ncbi:hypothetical protein A6V36_22690 [Paraburkholderia ginsengiterrae]|uniref:DUF1853 domain-containing protein n=1 Tax=Paraburkholderia ginsengiterrae TaxID=1462993 RepID=A0A1A9N6H7_9BURK|nr:DUF1853 family protein [Paraburkholderia ginsengiterrae]OAJ59350.1 hypothetical protein A6V37_27400 [Paraburkholderia ginsengiterrae]OAJ62012.1 hypothetical protein A6V36_22690 [Paraburkholderia ginsengiterrae]
MAVGAPAAHPASASATHGGSIAALLDSLRDPAVRDLAWLLLSPNLLRPQPPVGALAALFDNQQEAQACLAWLRALDAAPAPLHDDLAAKRITRLGLYAERLLGWFLQHGPAARLVAAGVQLRRAGVTLGECDFLVRTQQGVRLHWELAVKCYLHAGVARDQATSYASTQLSEPESARLSDYVGPNLKDRFDLKLAHVLNHQLPLSAREEFASVGYAGPWIPQMFIKGWLFYRQDETPLDPVELDPAHGRGWWVTRADWPAFAAAQAGKWRPLPRLEWLAPQRHEPGEAQAGELALVDAQTLVAQTSQQHGPAMVAAFSEDSAGNLIERSRGFIVPDEWPGQAQDYARR